ncbi:MAG TPA: hypothetical protein VK196_05315 [Magnetospirillum sp.]|nr:hypothetical protein [Magnetospirillum sp.]
MGEKLGTRTATDPREPGRKVPQYQSNPEDEDDVDLAGEDSFPASDPPSHTPISHPGKPCDGKS